MKKLAPSLKLAFKFALVSALLYFLSQKGFLSLSATKRAFSRWEYVGPGMGCLVVTAILAIYRWYVLLSAQGIRLGISRILQLTFVGSFFNIALPGAVSGDVIKAIYVAKEIQGRRAHSLSSILFDRVAGVSALILVSGVALLMSLASPAGERLLQTVGFFVLAATAFVVVFFGYLFIVKEDRDPVLALCRRLEQRIPRVGSITRIYEGIRTYHHERGAIVVSLAVSVIIHLLVIVSFVFFSLALGEDHLQPLSLCVIVPLGLLVTAIPVMPAGVGTGHVAFSWLFMQIGSERGADTFSLFVLFQLLQGIFGGLIYLRFKSQATALGIDLAAKR
ncbi:MAG: lysylphosphatidylglycerol synthase transmembrane domain-containing protein [Bacteriovoracia bacterium]